MKLFYSFALAGALLASVANAQTWPKPNTSGNMSVRSAGVISTGTAIAGAPVRDTSSALDVLLTASSNTQMNVDTYLDNGNSGVGLKVSSTTVTANATQLIVHVAAPLNFQWLKVSPTVAITNTTVSATIIQSK